MSYAISNDGTRIWFDVLGKYGDPILLIAGCGCDHNAWKTALADLLPTHKVIVYDHRGTGLSDAEIPASWSTRDFADDAMAVISAAGFDRIHVYGHSMGGRVAQWLAIEYPMVVSTLVLGATSAGGGPWPS